MTTMKTIASFALLGAVIAGVLGHHSDQVQFAAALAGAIFSGFFLDKTQPGSFIRH